jgi:rsbT co-antagonist protein RsbR
MNESQKGTVNTMQSTSFANSSDTAASLLKDYNITEHDLLLVQEAGEVVLPKIDEFVDRFYQWLRPRPEYSEFFIDETLEAQVRKLQSSYWTLFFSANVDEDYVTDRRRVGATHARIGLPLGVYFASMNMALDCLVDMVAESENRSELIRSMTKLTHLDSGVVFQEYAAVVGEAMASQSKTLMEMSTPVTQIWDGVLMLPVVGIIDSKRAQDIMNAMLRAIEETKARNFIFDISGVAVVDTAVANYIIKITKATALMGCECVISGVSPAIAQTIVELGIDVGTVRTTANLKDALSGSFRRLGVRLVTGSS